MITSFDFIAAQAPSDARRFSELGAAPDRLCVTGSLKFDLELPASLLEQAQALRRLLGVNRPVLTCGSTREGEEAVLVGAFAKLKARFPDLLVVLAPRHPERFDDVADFCRAAGFNVIAHSDSPTCRPETDIYLVDVMGDLPRFYAASDVAFVGGSLLPFGGHNVLEPAALGTPIVSGRYTYNFSEICELLQAGEVLQVVTDVDGFVRVVTNWLDDSNERDRVGRIGSEIVRNHRGATRRTVDLVEQVLAASGRADGAPLVAR